MKRLTFPADPAPRRLRLPGTTKWHGPGRNAHRLGHRQPPAHGLSHAGAHGHAAASSRQRHPLAGGRHADGQGECAQRARRELCFPWPAQPRGEGAYLCTRPNRPVVPGSLSFRLGWPRLGDRPIRPALRRDPGPAAGHAHAGRSKWARAAASQRPLRAGADV